MKTLLFCFALFAVLTDSAQTVTDIDGNVYPTVIIGNQEWMAENLRVTHYQNGDSIPLVIGSAAWSALATDAQCYYNGTFTNVAVYGRLYNWYVVNDSRQVAPAGWHVPTDAEWYQLANFLGDSATSGAYLKQAGNLRWNAPNTGATNSSGFTALPSGYRDPGSSYGHLNLYNNFWTTTVNSTTPTLVYHRGMAYNHTEVLRYLRTKNHGFAIRCVKNKSTGTGSIESNPAWMSLYPNPAVNTITIDSPEEGTLQMISIHGQVLGEYRIHPAKNELDVSALAQGLYTLKLVTAKGVVLTKMIKQ
jgi:uncharacterized protein (TIGR02145 family)